MTTRRRFTDDFKVGDRVRIIRTRHGWHDGGIAGEIVKIGPDHCTVEVKTGRDQDRGMYDIEKPRDIRKAG